MLGNLGPPSRPNESAGRETLGSPVAPRAGLLFVYVFDEFGVTAQAPQLRLGAVLGDCFGGRILPDSRAAHRGGAGVGAFTNATPIVPCPFQIVRAARKDPSLSIRSSNVSGTPMRLGSDQERALG